MSGSAPVFVSVVIATRNRATLLARTLDALAVQRWPEDQLEVIVSDNGSTDGTADVVEDAARGGLSIRYLFVPTPGKSHAVNAALAVARGDLLAFTDDDVVPESDWVAALARASQEADADFVAGRIWPIWEIQPPRWMSPALYGVLAIPDNGDQRLEISAASPSAAMPIGANMAVRASAIASVGGLRTDLGKLSGTLRTGEDHEFFLRLLRGGCRGVYEPAALVGHFVPADRLNRRYFRRWLHQNGRDVARLERAYPAAVPRLFGVPRYLWRQCAVHAAAAGLSVFPGSQAKRFASISRVLWFAGYVRESWFGHADAAPLPLAAAEGR
jgi:cellulose synthase/poly-beta-1,6-N-acetylglucosamine synthase-like glycosyltransferase